MNPYNFSLLCFGFCTILLAILIFLKRTDLLGKRFLVFSLFCSAWALAIGVNFSESASDSLALFSARLGNAFALFIPVSWYHFILTFVGKEGVYNHRIKILYILAGIIFLFAFSPWFISGVRWIVDFRCCIPEPMFFISPLSFFLIVPLGFLELFKKIKTAESHERQQMVGLAVATGIGFLGGGLTYFPVYGIPLPQYGLFITPIYAFALAYFMIKQKLFDISALADAVQEAKLSTLGVIASSINHEIRNPLYVIKGLAETLLEKADAYDREKIKEMAGRTIAQSDRALGIIRNFSAYAKRETGRTYEKQGVRIKELIERILPFVESELKLKGVTITQEIPEELTALADRQSLEEIFLNLIINACQAIQSNSPSEESKSNWTGPGNLQSEKNSPNTHQFPRSGNWGNPDCRNGKENKSQDRGQGQETGKEGQIVIKADAVVANGNGYEARIGDGHGNVTVTVERNGHRCHDPKLEKVVISVSDTGPGILPENQNRIFEPFYTTKPSGTGLGLYVVKQLVDKNGGKIEVRSKPGAGATFVVSFPMEQKDAS